MSTQSDELVFIVDETHEDQVCSLESLACKNEAVVVIEWVCASCNQKPVGNYCLKHESLYFTNSAGTPYPDGQRHARCSEGCQQSYPKGLGAHRVYPVRR